MKKIIILLLVCSFALIFVYCNGNKEKAGEKDQKENTTVELSQPQKDAKEMLEMMDDFADKLLAVTEDSIIDDEEVAELKRLNQVIDDFYKKYELESEDKKVYADYLESNREEADRIFEKLYMAASNAAICEGFEKMDQ